MFAHFLRCLAFAGMLLFIELVRCDDDLRVQINLKKPLHTVAEEFVSFTVSASDLRQLEYEAE